MNIGANSHFANVPTIDRERSTYPMSCNIKTSFNVGDVIPFFTTEVLPGDTWDLKTSKVIRMQPLAVPPMDSLFLDTYYFYIPYRILWKHWANFLGENSDSAWIPDTEYEIPQIHFAQGCAEGSIGDYLGVPPNMPCTVNALPFRAYAKIIDEWFRSETLQQPLYIPLDDATIEGVKVGNQQDITQSAWYVSETVKGGRPFIANKYFDLFTSCLPSPQKGPDVTVPLSDFAPVVTKINNVPRENFYYNAVTTPEALHFAEANSNNVNVVQNGSMRIMNNSLIMKEDGNQDGTGATYAYPSNLWARLDQATSVSINQLRTAFQIQRFYETNARSGSRYRELLKAHFGVTLEDARAMIPEFLGGSRIPLNMNQVASTQTADLGMLGAYSLTNDTHDDFLKSFPEHGLIMGVCCVRYKHTYSQGLQRFFSKKTKFDFFFPTLANIGETAVKTSEIFLTDSDIMNNRVFGYNEAWYEYRYLPDLCSSEMRPKVEGFTQSYWHFGDLYSVTPETYAGLPTLSDEWLMEDKNNVDRVLTHTSKTTNQLIADILVTSNTTRVVPTYSVPGYIDHN